MKLYNSDSMDSSSPLQRLMRSLTGEMTSPPLGRQAAPITAENINSIFGSADQFMADYKNFEANYFRLLQDPANRRKFARVRDINIERQSGTINLSHLNYENQRLLTEQFNRTVLRADELFSRIGLPGLEFPSGNIFSSSLLKFDISSDMLGGGSVHPAAAILNRMFVNVDPNKPGMSAFNFGKSNLLSSESLERIAKMQDFDSIGKRVLTFDVETTGVTYDSQVRQFAYEIQEADGSIRGSSKSFINDQMEIANVSKSGVSTRMSRSVFTSGLNPEEMGQGGENFVRAAKDLYTEMLNVDHVSGHNLLFDINKMSDTLHGLEAFRLDQDAQRLHNEFFERKSSQADYLIDTQETMRSYFTKKASDLNLLPGQRPERIVSQLLGPEMLAQIGIGGSTTPMSVENIALNSNLFELLERDDIDRARDIAEKLKAGSHIADTDVAIQASMEKYRSLGELNFRFNIDGSPIGDPLSDFEKYARSRILKSQAMVPTRDIASVIHAGESTKNFMLTEPGMQRATVLADTSALGMDTESNKGFLKFNRSTDQYEFTRFGSLESSSVDSLVAKNYISSTFREAFSEGEGSANTLRIGSSALRITRNLADEQILNFGINFIQESKVQRISSFKADLSTSGITGDLADDNTLLRSLGTTSQQFAETKSVGNVLNRISNSLRGNEFFAPMRKATSVTDDVLKEYQMNIAKVGLPFSTIDPVDRMASVRLSQVTSDIGQAAGMNLTHARNSKLTSEFGLSYAKGINAVRIGEINAAGDLVPASRVILPFQELFEYGQSVDSATGNITSQTLRVKAFAEAGLTDEIISSDLNRLTISFVEGRTLEDGKVISPRANLVFGANKTLSKEEATALAEYQLKNAQNYEDLLRTIGNSDSSLTSSINKITNLKNTLPEVGTEDRQRITAQLAEHIRDRGIATLDLGDADKVESIFREQGMDLTSNDVRMKDLSVRLTHFDADSNTATLSAMSDNLVDEQMGRTSRIAQEESLEALNRQIKVESLLDDSANKRIATRTVLEAQNATRTEQAISAGSRRVQNTLVNPMTDFYLKNKPKIGYAGIGLAAAGIGYYMSKKQKEKSLYNESLESQPTEANMGRAMSSSPAPAELAQLNSTRRDPLTTAGIVGNMDRNKIGHSQMGPNKYNHLYGA